MLPDTRIAVIEPEHGRLLAAVRALPVRCQVVRFVDLGRDMGALMQFRPAILVCQTPAADEDFGGAVRVARAALGDPPVVLVTTREAEAELMAVARRIGARVLVEPDKPGHLAAALERTLAGADPQLYGTFLEIARGLGDELNNPLMYLSGHLQLLARSLAGDPRLDQVTAAQAGVRRIVDTVDLLRLVVEAETGMPRPTDLIAVTRSAFEKAPAVAPLRMQPALAPMPAEILVPAVPALIPALASLAGWLQHFVEAGGFAEPWAAAPPRPALGFELSGGPVTGWDPPRTFAPYALGRGLKGGPHGLTLFLLHTAVHASGGLALARRRLEGGLVIELRWP